MTLSKTTVDGTYSNLALTKKQECFVCTFSDKQEDIVETQNGYAHAECINDHVEFREIDVTRTYKLVPNGNGNYKFERRFPDCECLKKNWGSHNIDCEFFRDFSSASND